MSAPTKAGSTTTKKERKRGGRGKKGKISSLTAEANENQALAGKILGPEPTSAEDSQTSSAQQSSIENDGESRGASRGASPGAVASAAVKSPTAGATDSHASSAAEHTGTSTSVAASADEEAKSQGDKNVKSSGDVDRTVPIIQKAAAAASNKEGMSAAAASRSGSQTAESSNAVTEAETEEEGSATGSGATTAQEEEQGEAASDGREASAAGNMSVTPVEQVSQVSPKKPARGGRRGGGGGGAKKRGGARKNATEFAHTDGAQSQTATSETAESARSSPVAKKRRATKKATKSGGGGRKKKGAAVTVEKVETPSVDNDASQKDEISADKQTAPDPPKERPDDSKVDESVKQELARPNSDIRTEAGYSIQADKQDTEQMHQPESPSKEETDEPKPPVTNMDGNQNKKETVATGDVNVEAGSVNKESKDEKEKEEIEGGIVSNAMTPEADKDKAITNRKADDIKPKSKKKTTTASPRKSKAATKKALKTVKESPEGSDKEPVASQQTSNMETPTSPLKSDECSKAEDQEGDKIIEQSAEQPTESQETSVHEGEQQGQATCEQAAANNKINENKAVEDNAPTVKKAAKRRQTKKEKQEKTTKKTAPKGRGKAKKAKESIATPDKVDSAEQTLNQDSLSKQSTESVAHDDSIESAKLEETTTKISVPSDTSNEPAKQEPIANESTAPRESSTIEPAKVDAPALSQDGSNTESEAAVDETATVPDQTAETPRVDSHEGDTTYEEEETRADSRDKKETHAKSSDKKETHAKARDDEKSSATSHDDADTRVEEKTRVQSRDEEEEARDALTDNGGEETDVGEDPTYEESKTPTTETNASEDETSESTPRPRRTLRARTQQVKEKLVKRRSPRTATKFLKEAKASDSESIHKFISGEDTENRESSATEEEKHSANEDKGSEQVETGLKRAASQDNEPAIPAAKQIKRDNTSAMNDPPEILVALPIDKHVVPKLQNVTKEVMQKKTGDKGAAKKKKGKKAAKTSDTSDLVPQEASTSRMTIDEIAKMQASNIKDVIDGNNNTKVGEIQVHSSSSQPSEFYTGIKEPEVSTKNTKLSKKQAPKRKAPAAKGTAAKKGRAKASSKMKEIIPSQDAAENLPETAQDATQEQPNIEPTATIASASSQSLNNATASSAQDPAESRSKPARSTDQPEPGAAVSESESDSDSETSSGASGSDSRPCIGNKHVGCHVSMSRGLAKGVVEAASMNARAFGMFLKSQKSWKQKELDEGTVNRFQIAMKEYGYSHHMVVPHGGYLMNLASPDDETREKSVQMLIHELRMCEKLKLPLFNFHPGYFCQLVSSVQEMSSERRSTGGKMTKEGGIRHIVEGINRGIEATHNVRIVLENMACQGHTIGGRFEELREIISHVRDKSRIGVCFDTCHAMAAGYDLSTESGYQATMHAFDNIIGFRYLVAVHINDCKGRVGCRADKHEDIGKGTIGLDGFERIMNDQRFDHIPFILETPGGDYDRQIKKLYKLVKK